MFDYLHTWWFCDIFVLVRRDIKTLFHPLIFFKKDYFAIVAKMKFIDELTYSFSKIELFDSWNLGMPQA